MKRNKLFLSIAVLVLVLLLFSFSTQVYVKRGVQGGLKQATDDIGSQYSVGNTSALKSTGQYEPYYLTSNYTVNGNQKSNFQIPTVRKLIKKADFNIKVKECSTTLENIKQISNSVSGVLMEASIQNYVNVSETGRAVLKVFPKDFDLVLNKLRELGHVDNEQISGDDVTEEYVDLSSRLTNSQHVRDRLVKILEVNAGTVKDILEVEREIARTGEQMEQIQGRMKLIDTQVNLSTITVNFYEEKPISSNSINISGKFKETMRSAFDLFFNTFNGFILLLAVLIPAIFWITLISGCIYLVVRFVKNRK